MELDVYSANVTDSNGELMVFDIIFPKGEADVEGAKLLGVDYVHFLHRKISKKTKSKYVFCNCETATPVQERMMDVRRYHIIPISNCDAAKNYD